MRSQVREHLTITHYGSSVVQYGINPPIPCRQLRIVTCWLDGRWSSAISKLIYACTPACPFCLTAFRFVVHRRVVNETRTQRVSFTKGRKKEPVGPRARKEEEEEEEYEDDDDEEGKTSSTKLNRNDPQGRRSSALLLTLPCLASSFEMFLRSHTAFIPNRLLSLPSTFAYESLRNAEACK